MTLCELMKFLQRMAETSLDYHQKKDPDNAFEIGYHIGQLSILDAMVPLVPADVEPLDLENKKGKED